jgi:hypothetical protein
MSKAVHARFIRFRRDRLLLGAEKNGDVTAPKLAEEKAGLLRRNPAVILRTSIRRSSLTWREERSDVS